MSENRTGKDILNDIANNDTTTTEHDSIMQIILRKIGFPEAIVTCGIVYLKGHGTIDFPPMSIQSIAKMILQKAEEQQQV